MNANLKTILADAKQENVDEKIELIRDIFNVKRQLFGFGFREEEPAVLSPETIFDCLYEQSIDDLTLTYATLCAKLSAFIVYFNQ